MGPKMSGGILAWLILNGALGDEATTTAADVMFTCGIMTLILMPAIWYWHRDPK